MRKLFLLFAVMFCITATAQENDSKRVLEISDIVMQSDDMSEKENALIELQEILKTTKDPAVKMMGDEMYSSLKELFEMQKTRLPIREVDFSDKKLFRNYRVEYDKFKDTRYIYPRGWTLAPDVNSYIVIRDGKMNLLLNISYKGSEWLFMDKLAALVDDEKFEFNINESSRKVELGGVYETSTNYVDEFLLNFIRKLASSKSAEIRMEGKRYYDYKIPLGTKENLTKILEMYDNLKQQ